MSQAHVVRSTQKTTGADAQKPNSWEYAKNLVGPTIMILGLIFWIFWTSPPIHKLIAG